MSSLHRGAGFSLLLAVCACASGTDAPHAGAGPQQPDESEPTAPRDELDAGSRDGSSRDAGLLDARTVDVAEGDATHTVSVDELDAALVRDAEASDAALEPADAGAPMPLFAEIASYLATLPGHNDQADIYYPNPSDLHTASYDFPVAVMLQGANVPRAEYSGLSRALAGYGFIVVSADHPGLLGLFAEQQQLLDAQAFLKSEDTRVGAPVAGVVDTTRLAVLGHSFGGVAGLGAAQGTCSIPFCSVSFVRPPELLAAALFGTNTGDMPARLVTAPVAVALIQGSLDSKALPTQAAATYAQLDRPRALFTIAGANHYGVCDHDNPTGAAAETAVSVGPQADLVQANARAAGWFLRAALGDPAARAWLLSLAGKSDGLVSVRLEN